MKMDATQRPHKSALTKVRVIKKTMLPRFSLIEGEFWDVRTAKLTRQGFIVGGGFLEKDRYEIIGG